MIDLICVAELAWIFVWIGTRPKWRASLYATGLFIAAITAFNLSNWIEGIVTPISSPAFKWIQGHISHSQSVLMNRFLPAQAAWTGGHAQSQWIAHSVLKSLLFFVITASVFLAFVIVGQLVLALWDSPKPVAPRRWLLSSVVMGGASAVYLTLLTVVTIGNLAWLKNFSALQILLGDSLVVHMAGHLLTLVQFYT